MKIIVKNSAVLYYAIVEYFFKSMLIRSVASVGDSLNISQGMTAQSLLTFI